MQLKDFIRVQMYHGLLHRVSMIGMVLIMSYGILSGRSETMDVLLFLAIGIASAILIQGCEQEVEALESMYVDETFVEKFQHIMHVWKNRLFPDW